MSPLNADTIDWLKHDPEKCEADFMLKQSAKAR
jgi:hypothetical protein